MLDTSWGLHNVEFVIPWLTGNLQKIRIVFWGVAVFLLSIVCSADLDRLSAGRSPTASNEKTMGEGWGEELRQRENTSCVRPMGFWNSVRQLTEQAVSQMYRQNVNQANVSKVRVPVQTCEYTFHQQGYLELREWNDELTLSLAFMFTQVKHSGGSRYFRPNRSSKGQKNFFRPFPPFSQGLNDRPLPPPSGRVRKLKKLPVSVVCCKAGKIL